MSEQVYLKCTSVAFLGEGSFTQGSVYEAKPSAFSGDHFRVINDKGNPSHVPLIGSLWQFEIIEDSCENSKICPRSLGCFREVADVIGEEAAEIELQRVIDYPKDLIGEDSNESLTGCFYWDDTPQGSRFWIDISNGKIPETYDVNQKSTQDSPALGDVLHYNGGQVVYLSNLHSGCHLVSFENGITLEVTLDDLDEYKPNETQELRNRILERYQRKSLDNAWDTFVCRVDMSVSDLIDFVVDNLNAEYSGD